MGKNALASTAQPSALNTPNCIRLKSVNCEMSKKMRGQEGFKSERSKLILKQWKYTAHIKQAEYSPAENVQIICFILLIWCVWAKNSQVSAWLKILHHKHSYLLHVKLS